MKEGVPISSHAYDDIIHLPHPLFPNRRHMTPIERAAQFSPFAALTGYEDAIAEEARLTDQQVEPGDWAQEELNEKLLWLQAHISEHPILTVTYFQPDHSKPGGRYVTVSGRLKKLRLIERELLLAEGAPISLDAVLSLTGDFENDSF